MTRSALAKDFVGFTVFGSRIGIARGGDGEEKDKHKKKRRVSGSRNMSADA